MISHFQKLDESGYDSGLDDFVDGRVGLPREQLPELLRRRQLLVRRSPVENVDHLGSDRQWDRSLKTVGQAQRRLRAEGRRER